MARLVSPSFINLSILVILATCVLLPAIPPSFERGLIAFKPERSGLFWGWISMMEIRWISIMEIQWISIEEIGWISLLEIRQLARSGCSGRARVCPSHCDLHADLQSLHLHDGGGGRARTIPPLDMPSGGHCLEEADENFLT